MPRKHLTRRFFAAALSLLLAVAVCIPVFASPSHDFPAEPVNSYIADEMNVISDDTRDYVDSRGWALEEATGAQIVFVIVDFTGGYEIDDYAYELFNTWGVGDKKENNGLLYVLALGADDYYVMPGSGVTSTFSGSTLQRILDDCMEPGFAAGDYDAAVRKTFERSCREMEKLYGVDTSDYGYTGADYGSSGGMMNAFHEGRRIMESLIVLIIILVVLVILVRALRVRRTLTPGQPYWRTVFLPRRTYRTYHTYRTPPPPPPPHHHGGFGGFGHPPPRPPMGGRGGHPGPSRPFGGSRPSMGSRPGGSFSRPSAPSRPSRPSGGSRPSRPSGGRPSGMGGGISRGGGAGRRR